MAAIQDTVDLIVNAKIWNERVARLRRVPQRHGTDEHAAIYAQIATQLYVPQLAPDYAYVNSADFYELAHFHHAYEKADAATAGFKKVTVERLAAAIRAEPIILLPLRVITGLTRAEFAASSKLVADPLGMKPLSPNKVDSMERSGTPTSAEQARVAAETVDQIMHGVLFGDPPGDLRSKQDKPDTVEGWLSVRDYAANRVPYEVFLHQRHYGGGFRQLLDATSELRGNLIEDAVEALFVTHGIAFIRTGSHNQADIAAALRSPCSRLPTLSSTTGTTLSGRCWNARELMMAAPLATRLPGSSASTPNPSASAESRCLRSSVAWAGPELTTRWALLSETAMAGSSP